jgi:hypothetical protein
MPLYMDVHEKVEGLTAEAVAQAHAKDLEVQAKYGVKYLKYWFDVASGKVFCLVEAPNKDAAASVHRHAHGLVADSITEVKEGA